MIEREIEAIVNHLLDKIEISFEVGGYYNFDKPRTKENLEKKIRKALIIAKELELDIKDIDIDSIVLEKVEKPKEKKLYNKTNFRV